MQTKPTIRDAWDFLYRQGAVNAPGGKQAAAVDPLEVRRQWFAQQLTNVVMHKAMRAR